MSQNLTRGPIAAPKTERWVVVMVCSFVPVLEALFVPQAARIPLLAVAGVIFAIAFALMLRQSRQSAGDESLLRLVHSESD